MVPVTETPKVSVVIPTYNRAHVVGRAVQSVLHQTYQNFEIIIVDDGSTDGTSERVALFHDPRLFYVRLEENCGCGAARNMGIEASRGDYVAFLDSDDEWLPEKLEKQVRLLERSEPSVGIVYTGYVAIDEQELPTTTRIPKSRGRILNELCGWNILGTTSTVVVKRECFRLVRPFDPTLASCEDWDMYIRLAKRFKFDFIPEVLVRYHLGDSGRMTKNWYANAEGHVRIAKNYLSDADSFPRRQRARQFFELGTGLVGLGYDPGYPEPIRLGRQFLLAAFLAYPLAPRYLVHYGASVNSLVYRVLTRTRPRVRKLLTRLAANPAGVEGVWPQAERFDQPQQHPPTPEDGSRTG